MEIVLWLGSFGGGSAEEPSDIHYDFRGQPLPPSIVTYRPVKESYLKTEPEGLRVTLTKDRANEKGMGLSMPVNILGDFEITVAMEILDVEEPTPEPPSYGLGVLMSINETVRIGRLLRTNGVEVVTWDRWATVDGERKWLVGASPCQAKTLRLRLKRQATIVHFLWAPDLVGDTFHEFYRCPFAEEIRELRLESNSRQRARPTALDFRLIDLRIRTVFARNV